MRYEYFFKLLRIALDVESPESFTTSLSQEEWEAVYREMDRQTLVGLGFSAIEKIAPEKRPPVVQVLQWSSDNEFVRGANRLMNRECERLTALFEKAGRRTAILKGQANARLYPDPFCRQPGDVDIWVEGGKKNVVRTLNGLGLMDGASVASHHVNLPSTSEGVSVEVHFKPCSGNYNAFATRRMNRYLLEALRNCSLVPEGFYVPPAEFALVMQMSHLQHHFMDSGLGMRQLVDYFILLRSSKGVDRENLAVLFKRFGMDSMAGAVMWLCRECLGLDSSLLIGRCDEKRGRWLLREVLEGGNFGLHSNGRSLAWLYWWVGKRKKSLGHLRFDFAECVWAEMAYWARLVKDVPLRVKKRKWSFREEYLQ